MIGLKTHMHEVNRGTFENPVSKALYFSREPWSTPLCRGIPEFQNKKAKGIRKICPHVHDTFSSKSISLELASWMLPEADFKPEMHCAAR
jgi:hypothetical protein